MSIVEVLDIESWTHQTHSNDFKDLLQPMKLLKKPYKVIHYKT